MIIEKLNKFIQKLNASGFSGKIELNFHKGDLSGKVKKEITLSENDIDWVNAQRDVEYSPPPQAKGEE